jgi:Leucine-rich repeat (LRR) protein
MSEFNIEAYLDSLPANIPNIDVKNKNLTYIPASIIRFKHLIFLDCSYNKLTSLPLLPKTLINLFCNHNELTYLPVLPKSLKYLECTHNRLLQLPTIPARMFECVCYHNQLTSLPMIHNELYLLSFVNPVNDYLIDVIQKIRLFGRGHTIERINKFRYTYYGLKMKQKLIAWYLLSKRKNYLMILDGMKPSAEHHYILNQYVGMDIMSYV